MDPPRCIRCGDERYPACLCCAECGRVLGYLMLTLGLDFAAIARSGEVDSAAPGEPGIRDLMSRVPRKVSKRAAHEERVLDAVEAN